MLNKLFSRRHQVLQPVEYNGIAFPISTLQILLAQSASAEVRRQFEPKGNIFELIKVSREFQHGVLESYVKANLKFFDLMTPHIPANCSKVLDIGCGIGLLDLLIYRYATDVKPKLYLFDKSVDVAAFHKSNIAPTGFNEKYVFTASLEHTAEFLRLNGVADEDIELCEVGNWKIKEGMPFDLVFSRKSWGFHYPLSEYLIEVAETVSKHGVVLTDLRDGQDGDSLLKEYFAHVEVVERSSKSALMAACLPKISQ